MEQIRLIMLVESRIRGDVYVRFGGEYLKTYHSNMERRRVLSLLYVFDRKLRLLVFEAIERLEVTIRTQIIYQLSHKYGSHWQDRLDIFNPPTKITLRDGRKVTVDV